MRWWGLLCAVGVGAPFVAGCGDEATTECIEVGRAEVCARATRSTQIEIDAEGLEAGSELRIADDLTGGDSTYTIGASGSLPDDGAVGLLSVVPIDTVTFTVSGTTADGKPIEGMIIVEP